MARTTIKTETKPVKRLTQAQIDEKVARILVLKEKEKEIVSEIKKIEEELKAQFVHEASVKEEYKGKNFFFEKICVQNGKNNYNVEKVKALLTGIRGALKKVVKKVEVIETKELNQLVKDGKISMEDLEKCREVQWTYRMNYGRIEANAQQQDQTNRRGA